VFKQVAFKTGKVRKPSPRLPPFLLDENMPFTENVTSIVDIFSNSSNNMKKKKKSCLSADSEVSRFPNFTVVMVLQLVVLPNRTLRTKAIHFLHVLFGFPFGAKSYTAQP
jgi:hypothetical protein